MKITNSKAMKLKNRIKISAGLIFASLLCLSSAQAGLLLEIDLSVENTISISATNGVSLISATGSDITGIYLDEFFGDNTLGSFNETLISGDLNSANEASDLSPNLFHFNDDPGLNIFSTSVGSSLSFTQGAIAFLGSATWTISENFYQHFLTSATSGNIFFPADSIDDINNALILGSWSVVGLDSVSVSEPSALTLFALAAVLFGFRRETESSAV